MSARNGLKKTSGKLNTDLLDGDARVARNALLTAFRNACAADDEAADPIDEPQELCSAGRDVETGHMEVKLVRRDPAAALRRSCWPGSVVCS